MQTETITKAGREVLLGWIGIILQKNLPLRTKISLFVDSVRCIAQLLVSKRTGCTISTFRISAFDYTVHFSDFSAFYFVFNEIFCKAIYSKDFTSQLVIDGGANIGMYILWVRYFNKQCKIMAFEPSEITYELLLKNIEVNNITDCETQKIALSSIQGTTDFYTIHDEIQVLNSGLHLDQDLPYSMEIVKTDILSNYVGDRPIDFLKLDIEGSEYEVIEEMSSSGTLSHVKAMIVEVHFPNKHQISYEKMLESLRSSGNISIYRNSGNTEVIHYEKR